jgi:putative ribosome biogenesis GTPase RsgA
MLVVTLVEPITAVEFIDRFLVTCEAYKVPVTILLAKIDLLQESPEAVAEFHRVYEGAGYTSKGIYRPVTECRMKINEAPAFCPVCQRALERLILFYTEK